MVEVGEDRQGLLFEELGNIRLSLPDAQTVL